METEYTISISRLVRFDWSLGSSPQTSRHGLPACGEKLNYSLFFYNNFIFIFMSEQTKYNYSDLLTMLEAIMADYGGNELEFPDHLEGKSIDDLTEEECEEVFHYNSGTKKPA